MRFPIGFDHSGVGTLLVSLVAACSLQAQTIGQSPNRLDLTEQVGQARQAFAKGAPQQVVVTASNTEATYLDSAFWNAPPLPKASIHFKWPADWGLEDKRGDTRLKRTWTLASWNPDHDETGADHFYLRFDLQRVVTSSPDFSSQGHLGDALYAKMTAGGLLSGKTTIKVKLNVSYEKPNYTVGSETVHLHDLMYDVIILDVNGTPMNIRFTGLKYGAFVPTLPLTVPTSLLRFPVRADPGKGETEPRAAWNVIHFKLVPPKVRSPKSYTFGGYPIIPATFIPYNFAMDAELTFGAMAPIFLVHGTNAGPETWDVPDDTSGDNYATRSFNWYFQVKGKSLNYLDFNGICFSDIKLRPNGSINNNSIQLSDQITERLKSVGAKACHIIAHSKGGLDTRAFIFDHYYHKGWNKDLATAGHFEVLSLYTLETPHRGTVLSDITWNKRNQLNAVAGGDHRAEMQSLMDWDLWLLGTGLTPDGGTLGTPAGDALHDQMTFEVEKFNKGHLFDFSKANTGGRPLKFYNTASDADWNLRNFQIDDSERKDSGYPGGPLGSLATSAYRMLYWGKRVDTFAATLPETTLAGTIPIPVTMLYIPPSQNGREWNDLVVTAGSALYDGGTLFPPLQPSGSYLRWDPATGYLLGNHSSLKIFELARLIVNQIRVDWPLNIP